MKVNLIGYLLFAVLYLPITYLYILVLIDVPRKYGYLRLALGLVATFTYWGWLMTFLGEGNFSFPVFVLGWSVPYFVVDWLFREQTLQKCRAFLKKFHENI